MKHILVLITALLLGACNPPEDPNVPPFRAAVEAHLAALSARDMEALLPTLTTGDTLIMFSPGGLQSDTRQQYIDYQRQWFANNPGRIEAEIIDVTESPAFGHALVRYRYGEPKIEEHWLTMTFDLENGGWRLSVRSEAFEDPRKKAKGSKLY